MISAMAPAGTPAATPLTLESVLAEIRNLPSLPAVVMELLALFEDENADTRQICSLINRDPPLTARVLRLANSSFYAVRGEVATIDDALTILGARNVRTLVLTAALTSSLPAFNAGWFDQDAFWRHAIMVAFGARLVAERVGLDGGIAFTAGLLHDIGQLVLVARFPDHYRPVMELHEHAGGFLFECERALLTLDHAAVGAALAVRWKFMPAIQQAVADHHRRDATPASMSGAVHIADAIIHALDDAGEAGQAARPPPEAALAQFGIEPDAIAALLDEIQTRSRAAAGLLAA